MTHDVLIAALNGVTENDSDNAVSDFDNQS